MKVFKYLVVIGLCLSLLIPYYAFGGWLDKWFDQAVGTAPGYFEGQKRGYFTAGSFSARVPSSTDYLISIDKPRLKAGCGGIDIFMGGFSFTNFDYLVKKFQRLIQAAPAVAFQIALNTLSSSLSSIIGKVEDIIDALNKLQFNECQILKPFTTIDLTKNDVEYQFEQAAKAAIESTGITDLFTDNKPKGGKVETKSGSTVKLDDVIKGCPSELQNLVDYKSFLGYVSATHPEYAEYVPYLRALIGDVVVSKDESSVKFTYTPGCAEAKYDSLKEGVLYRKDDPSAESCSKDNSSLRNKIQLVLTDVYFAMQGKRHSSRADEYKAIVELSPIPVYSMLRYASIAKDISIIANISDPVMKGVFYGATFDLMRELDRIVARLENVAQLRTSGSENFPCSIDLNTRGQVDELRDKLTEAIREIGAVYTASLREYSQAANVAMLYKQFEELAWKKLSETLGSSVTFRALSGSRF
ncbi:MAG: conjugal transfer protein TraH [Dictyoglomus turgidum]